MTRLLSLFVLLLLLPAASAMAGDLPQVLQPNATVYSASEVAALTQAIATLTEALNDYDMASRRYFSAGDWGSRDFAMYTAGVLSGKGYETVLVSEDGWPDGVHMWTLVGAPLGAKIVWIPVEASPEVGHTQQILGRIPSTTDVAGEMWFDTRYIAFTEAIALPPNTPPVAKIRKPALAPIAGESTQLSALFSSDPDGEIVLYQWDFGDGKRRTSTTWSIRHKFEEPGNYTVQLTVVDNHGKSATAFLPLGVAEDAGTLPPSEGCGCGG
ncbi:MAG: PKD domain-containing protein [Candidatus Thorarchaeota archaeon]